MQSLAPLWGVTPSTLSGTKALWWRGCQLVTMTTALISLYSFVLMYISVSSSVTRNHHHQPLSRTILRLGDEELRREPAEHRLIDLTHFEYVLEPRQPCGSFRNERGDRELYFVFYVHSAPTHFEVRIQDSNLKEFSNRAKLLLPLRIGLEYTDHFSDCKMLLSQERQIIRSTWGSQRNVSSSRGVRVVFLLGLIDDKVQNERILEEHRLYDDLVQGNFIDSYRNLSYKHLMGYKWVTSRCYETSFIVKADDDVFVDVIQLYWLLRNLYGENPRGILACSVWPSGSHPQRRSDEEGKGGKWAVPYDEYPYDSYPSYCGGLAYVLSPDVAKNLLAASQHVPFFWIDDLYATGLLAETVPHLRHHSLNLRTTYDTKALIRWLREGGGGGGTNGNRLCPFVFGDVSSTSGNTKRAQIMNKLWQKTVGLWQGHRPNR